MHCAGEAGNSVGSFCTILRMKVHHLGHLPALLAIFQHHHVVSISAIVVTFWQQLLIVSVFISRHRTSICLFICSGWQLM